MVLTFEDWLNEIENSSTRQERLEQDVNLEKMQDGFQSVSLTRRNMYKWLKAAYWAGVDRGANFYS